MPTPETALESLKIASKPCQIIALACLLCRKPHKQAVSITLTTPDNDTYLAYTAVQPATNEMSVKSPGPISFCTLFFAQLLAQLSPGIRHSRGQNQKVRELPVIHTS